MPWFTLLNDLKKVVMTMSTKPQDSSLKGCYIKGEEIRVLTFQNAKPKKNTHQKCCGLTLP